MEKVRQHFDRRKADAAATERLLKSGGGIPGTRRGYRSFGALKRFLVALVPGALIVAALAPFTWFLYDEIMDDYRKNMLNEGFVALGALYLLVQAALVAVVEVLFVKWLRSRGAETSVRSELDAPPGDIQLDLEDEPPRDETETLKKRSTFPFPEND